jgi:succinate dehydrogenase hydrophobic anchor subunit
MRWWGPIGLLAAIRVAIPLAAYGDAGSGLPGLPAFTRSPTDGGLTGDATGFYAATREFMAAWGRMPRLVLAGDALFALAAAVALVVLWRRRPAWHPWLVAAAVCAFGLVVCVDVHWMQASGAAVFGWPLLWALPMLAYRALGLGLSKHVAWDFGFALQLLCVGLTVFAVALLGRNASARRWVGVLAAAFWTFWPLLVGLIAGHHAWTNGQWEVDVGLHNYSEPLSTLLVTSGAALALSPRLTQMRLALAGCALSAATLVKLSNALLAAAVLVVVFLRGRIRETLPYLAGALALAPLVAAYWPISYPKLFDNRQSWPRDPFDPAHVVSSWTHSSIFTPHTLAIVVPLAAVGVAGLLRPWALALVLAFLLINPVFYSFYANTAMHPRFLYASLPELFVLWAAGIEVIRRAVLARPRLARSFAR